MFKSFGAGVALSLLACSQPAAAAQCGNGSGGFDRWLTQFKGEAAASGIKATTIAAALNGVSYDPAVIRLDHSQHSFKLSFDAFYRRRVDAGLINRGKSLMQTHKATLARIEQRYGVPGPVLMAIWGLETAYGAQTSGKYSILRSLATLAYEGRRPELFESELVDALRLLDRGTPAKPSPG